MRVIITVALVLASFAFWHSGARADGLCEQERFVRSGSLSAWPPGARCTYGLPAITDTLWNPWFVGTLVLVLPAGIALGGASRRR